jgi:hypothetical protein
MSFELVLHRPIETTALTGQMLAGRRWVFKLTRYPIPKIQHGEEPGDDIFRGIQATHRWK